MRRLDEALELLRWNGKYHLMMFAILAAITVRDPWPMFGIVFIGQAVDHGCKLPANSTAINDTVPFLCDADGCNCVADSCHLLSPPQLQANDSAEAARNGTSHPAPCTDGYEYATRLESRFHYALDYETSIVMEWDLVCDRSYLVDLSTTIYMAGVLLGSLLSQLSDRFGRKQVLLLSLWLQGVVAALTSLSTDFTQFAIARFAVGAINQVSVLVGFVYIIELYPASSRTKPGLLIQIFWGVGLAFMAPIAYLFKNWRLFQLATALPVAFFIPLYWILPESVFWLLSVGRTSDAEAVLQKAAKMNGIKLPENCLSSTKDRSKELQTFLAPSDSGAAHLTDSLNRSPSEVSNNESLLKKPERLNVLDVFRSPALRRYTIVLFSIWFVDSLNYVSLSLTTSELYGNKYVNFFIGGIVEIPAYIVAAVLANRFGRRMPILALSILGGASGVLLYALPTSLTGHCDDKLMEIVRTCVAMVGKFGITGSYAILVLLSPEIFPTSVRNLGLGLCCVCDNLGGMSAPLVNLLSHAMHGLPRLVVGLLAILGGLGVFLLPETHQRPLPAGVKDVEAWAKEHPNVLQCGSSCQTGKARSFKATSLSDTKN